MGVKVTNNAYGTLSAGIAAGDTTITLDGGQGARFPALGAGDYFYGTLVDTANNIEVVKVTARSSDSMTVVRGQDNTTARAYAIGDRFELRPTAALFDDIQTQIDNVDLSSRVAVTGDTMTGPLVINTGGNDQFRLTDGTQNLYMDTDSNGVAVAGGPGQTLGGLYLHNTNGWVSLFANNNLRLTVDTDGRVTMPYQPMFSARGSSSGTSWSGAVVVPFNTAPVNVGNHYNTSTYTFTAPVDGTYFFSASVLNYPSGSSSYITLHFSVNGGGYSGTIPMSRKPCASQETIQVSGLIKLSANDTVAARLADNSSDYYTASGHAHFDGMLIG